MTLVSHWLTHLFNRHKLPRFHVHPFIHRRERACMYVRVYVCVCARAKVCVRMCVYI